MTVLITYTTGSSKLLMDVKEIKANGDTLELLYGSNFEMLSVGRIREIKVAIN